MGKRDKHVAIHEESSSFMGRSLNDHPFVFTSMNLVI